MTDIPLFIFGAFITLIILGAIGALMWAAIEDGKVQAEKGGAVDHG